MRRGPKPQPRALRLLSGSHLERLNEHEPLPPAGAPTKPAYLEGLASEEWDRLADDLYGMGVLTVADTESLAAYCVAYARWRKAEADLDDAIAKARANRKDKTRGAALMETTNGNLVQNPLIGIANTARRDMMRLATEFGLSPSSRTLLEAGKRGSDDPLARKHFG